VAQQQAFKDIKQTYSVGAVFVGNKSILNRVDKVNGMLQIHSSVMTSVKSGRRLVPAPTNMQIQDFLSQKQAIGPHSSVLPRVGHGARSSSQSTLIHRSEQPMATYDHDKYDLSTPMPKRGQELKTTGKADGS
jgi:hypothetical protein